MIKRDKYLNQLVSERNNGFPKVITGIRRCGKSYLLKEIYKEYLLGEGIPEDDILILELDDDRNAKYRDPINLGDYVRSYCSGKKMCYVFLDEIHLRQAKTGFIRRQAFHPPLGTLDSFIRSPSSQPAPDTTPNTPK